MTLALSALLLGWLVGLWVGRRARPSKVNIHSRERREWLVKQGEL